MAFLLVILTWRTLFNSEKAGNLAPIVLEQNAQPCDAAQQDLEQHAAIARIQVGMRLLGQKD